MSLDYNGPIWEDKEKTVLCQNFLRAIPKMIEDYSSLGKAKVNDRSIEKETIKIISTETIDAIDVTLFRCIPREVVIQEGNVYVNFQNRSKIETIVFYNIQPWNGIIHWSYAEITEFVFTGEHLFTRTLY